MIKVNRQKLMDAMTARMVKLKADYDKEKREFDEAFAAFKHTVIEDLQAAVASCKSAKEFEHMRFLNKGDSYYRTVVVNLPNAKWPVQPEKPRDLGYIKEALKRLELSAEEVLTLRDDDNYLRYI